MGIRIGCMLVLESRHGFRDAARKLEIRKEFLKATVAAAADQDVRVLVLPAGFFWVSSVSEAEALADRLPAMLADTEMIVGLGIDTSEASKGLGKTSIDDHSGHSYWGLVIERGERCITLTQQSGIATDEVDQATVDELIASRISKSKILPGVSVALLMCGEILSTAWRSMFHEKAPGLILHPSHASVPIGGGSKESWKPKIDDLLSHLPRTSIWAFADHVAQGWHSDAGHPAPLVRMGGKVPTHQLATPTHVEVPGESGLLYVYEAQSKEAP